MWMLAGGTPMLSRCVRMAPDRISPLDNQLRALHREYASVTRTCHRRIRPPEGRRPAIPDRDNQPVLSTWRTSRQACL